MGLRSWLKRTTLDNQSRMAVILCHKSLVSTDPRTIESVLSLELVIHGGDFLAVPRRHIWASLTVIRGLDEKHATIKYRSRVVKNGSPPTCSSLKPLPADAVSARLGGARRSSE